MRALTRIATAATEAGLAELAGPMTANQLERFARAHRQVTQADDADARVRRRLTWRFEEDGSLSGTFRLPPLAGRGAAEGAARGLRRPGGPAGRAAGGRFRGNARRHGDAPAADAPAAGQTPLGSPGGPDVVGSG